MKVILRQDVYNLGKIGEVVIVKDGYARNYLLPREMVYFATPGAMKRLEIEKRQHDTRAAKEKALAEVLAVQLAEVQLSIPMKVGEENRLFGSVTPQMIAQELLNRGFNIDRRVVAIEDPIKTLGVFDVKIKLHTEVSATLKVWVINEEEQQ